MGWGGKNAVLNNRPVAQEPDSPAAVDEFIHAMHGLGMTQAEGLNELVDFTHMKTMLDMGGVSGAYSLVVTKKNPHMKAVLYDFPEVCDIARKFIRRFRAGSRVRICEGNIFADNVPEGFDVVLLSQVLHEYGPSDCLLILRKAYGSLNPGGLIIINETLINSAETGPPQAALFSVNMLVHSRNGSSYSGKRIKGWLKRIGYSEITIHSSGSLLAPITAREKNNS